MEGTTSRKNVKCQATEYERSDYRPKGFSRGSKTIEKNDEKEAKSRMNSTKQTEANKD